MTDKLLLAQTARTKDSFRTALVAKTVLRYIMGEKTMIKMKTRTIRQVFTESYGRLDVLRVAGFERLKKMKGGARGNFSLVEFRLPK